MPELVALALPGGPRFVDELRRVWDDGDTALPIDLRLPVPAQEALARELAATIVVDSSGTRHRVVGRPTEEGDALVVATSGTTGEPKGVVLTHDAVEASAKLTSTSLAVSTDDHWLACLPLAHIGGLSVVTRALHTGTRLTVLEAFNVDQVHKSNATLTSLVPTALQRIDASRFRSILVGGGPSKELPLNAIATYGMTETGSGIVYNGVPLDSVEIRVGSNDEILLRTPTLFRCYRDGSDPLTDDGWFPTGDAGTFEDRQLVVFGRIAEVINTGGEKVWPTAVERILRSHPFVRDAMVFGQPDLEWGQRVVACIETDEPNNDRLFAMLREHVKAVAPAYYAPKAIEVVAHLPRTSSGKLKRTHTR